MASQIQLNSSFLNSSDGTPNRVCSGSKSDLHGPKAGFHGVDKLVGSPGGGLSDYIEDSPESL